MVKKIKRTPGGQAFTGIGEPVQEEIEKPKEIDTFTDKSGRTSGFTDPRSGSTFFGGDPNMLKESIERISASLAPPQSAVSSGAGRISTGAEKLLESQRVAQSMEAEKEFETAGVFNKPEPTNLTPFQPQGIGVSPSTPVIAPLLSSLASRHDLARDIDLTSPDGQAVSQLLASGEINQQILDSGAALQNRFSIILEGIPVVGTLVGEYAKSLGTPLGKALTLKTTIIDSQKHIDVIDNSAGLNPTIAFDQINEVEKNINEMEMKLRLIVMQSPVLRASPYIVQDIAVDIDTARQKIFNARLNIANRRLQGITATDPQLFMTLDTLKKEADLRNSEGE